MTTRAGVRLLAIAALGCASVASRDQTSAVSGLTLRVVPKTVPVAVVRIENKSATFLLDWELEFLAADGRVARTARGSSTRGSLRAINDTTTSLEQGATRRLKFVTPDGFIPTSVRLTHVLAFYSTGSGGFSQYESDQAAVDENNRSFAAALASRSYWTTALAAAPSEESALRSFIQARIGESVARADKERDDLIRGEMLDLLQECAPDALRRGVRREQDDLERLARVPTPTNRTVAGPITSASATLEAPTTTDEVVASVTNERDTSADVWEVEEYSLPQSRAPFMTYTSHGAHDSRLAPASIERPLGPHDTRELPMMSASWLEGVVPAPRAVITVAIFDDGRVEGSADRARQLLAERARDAVDIEYWLGPLKLVRNVSAANAVDALRERVRTRKCESSTAVHADHFAAAVLAVASKIQATPEQKDTILGAAIARLEDERGAILKLVDR